MCQRLKINDAPLSEIFLHKTYLFTTFERYRWHEKLTRRSLLISKDTPYAADFAREMCAHRGNIYFPGCDEARVTYETLPYVNYAGASFCFIFSLSDLFLPSRCYRKPLNSWSFRGRERGEGRRRYKRPLSRMNKRGNRAGARCKFVTHVCRTFVRVRLFVKSNQILSNIHSRHFYKSSSCRRPDET